MLRCGMHIVSNGGSGPLGTPPARGRGHVN